MKSSLEASLGVCVFVRKEGGREPCIPACSGPGLIQRAPTEAPGLILAHCPSLRAPSCSPPQALGRQCPVHDGGSCCCQTRLSGCPRKGNFASVFAVTDLRAREALQAARIILGTLHALSQAVGSHQSSGGSGSRERDLESEAIAAQTHVLSKASGTEHVGIGASQAGCTYGACVPCWLFDLLASSSRPQ